MAPKTGKKYTQPQSLLEKCKLKLHWGIIFHLSDWQKSKRSTTHPTGKVVGQQACSHITCGNANVIAHIEGKWTLSQLQMCLPFEPIAQMHLPM